MNPFPTLFLCSISVLSPVAATDAPTVLRTFRPGGEGGWDYLAVDAKAGRIYVTRSTRVRVLDRDGRVAGEIPGTSGVHGVALCADLDRGWTSNGKAGTVTVFRLSTLNVEKEVPVSGQNPDAILYDPATRQVFTFNAGSHDATVLDAAIDEVKATIPLPGKPEFAVADGKGKVYCNDQDHALAGENDQGYGSEGWTGLGHGWDRAAPRRKSAGGARSQT